MKALNTPKQVAADDIRAAFQTNRTIFLICIFFLGIVILRNAWVCDDSYITFRTLDNWVNGLGLRWNPLERVQAFTNPLWLFTMAPFYLLTHEIYFTVIFISVAVSLAATAILLLLFARTTVNVLLVLAILICSKAFIDFSTSGLENPLSHLLLIIFYLRLIPLSRLKQPLPAKDVFIVTMISSLAMVNRLDHAILYAPALGWFLLQRPFFHSFKPVLFGMFPILLWELFSITYYGFPFPNTAYAKLSTGIWKMELWTQGFFYLLNSLAWDPITLFVVGAAVAKATTQRSTTDILIMAGAVLYLLYVVAVGGDHMSGRFLTASFLASTAVLAQIRIDSVWNAVAVLSSIVVLGFSSVHSPMFRSENSKDRMVDLNGIADERGFYFHGSGFLQMSRERLFRETGWARDGMAARQKGPHAEQKRMIGWYGYYAGPEVHIVDPLALSDPLLSRIPKRLGAWRVAHYNRDLPRGYMEAAFHSKKQLSNRYLHLYFNKLKIVTREPLFSLHRWKEIWKLNSGQYNYLIERYCSEEFSVFQYKHVSELQTGEHIMSKKVIHLNRFGIGVTPSLQLEGFKGTRIEMALSAGRYDVVLYQHHREMERVSVTVRQKGVLRDYLQTTTVKVSRDTAVRGYDQVRVYPKPRSAKRAFGGMVVSENVPIGVLQKIAAVEDK
ncbi:MAG: hypothetical protein JXX29_00195 [Deltaproteobacteria bacterium]|nr:hypothetical protein [Deltaproteobacteria bacterium]MBN2670055.1 hypothetical protein [Deltaproteobacteria bacterium]